MRWQAQDFRTLPVINGKAYEGGEVVLDGSSYINCSFNGCRVVYRGGPTRLASCRFGPGAVMFFEDQAAYMLQVLADMGWKIVPPSELSAF